MEKEMPQPMKFAKQVSRAANLKRFLLIGETKEDEAVIICWNGKEFQNIVDLIGLYALGARAIACEWDREKSEER